MKVRALLIASLAGLVSAPAASAQDVIVRFGAGADAAERTRARDAARTDFEQTLPVRGMQVVDPERGVSTEQAVAALERSADVLYAEPEVVRRKSVIPNDPDFGFQWNLHNTGQTYALANGQTSTGEPDADIDAPEAWQVTRGSRDVTVAVVDTGVDTDHPDLAPNLVSGRNFVGQTTGDAQVEDADGHGTHVAGTVGAAGNDGRGMTGVAWSVGLMPVRVLGDDGTGTTPDVIEGYLYAAAQGADVVNASLGGECYSRAERDAIASAPGTLFVVAAGNDGADNDGPSTAACPEGARPAGSYPCEHPLPNVVCVGSSGRYDALSSFSAYGDETVDLTAPGELIWSTYLGGAYRDLNGTSMATPHVAGAAALVRSLVPGASVAALRAALLGGVDRKAGLAGRTVTGGRLNAQRSLAVAQGAPPPPSAPPPAPRPAPAPVAGPPAPRPAPAPVARPPAPAAVSLALRVSVRSRHDLRRTLRRGLHTRLGCSASCRLSVRALVDRRTARRLRLGSGRRAVKVGSAGARLGGAGARTVRVRFGPRARSRIGRARSVRLTLELRAVDSRGGDRSAKRRVLLRR